MHKHKLKYKQKQKHKQKQNLERQTQDSKFKTHNRKTKQQIKSSKLFCKKPARIYLEKDAAN